MGLDLRSGRFGHRADDQMSRLVDAIHILHNMYYQFSL
jgi:hypothetical protein